MKKLLLLLVLVAIGVLIAMYISQKYFKGINLFPIPRFSSAATATINNKTFSLTVAKTPQEKEIGLSEKTSLPQDAGMLFPFNEPGFYTFWMRNMKIPIDILYINNNHITKIFQNVQPPKSQEENLPIYKPDVSSNMVLEINAGLSDKYKFKAGDEVKITGLATK